MFKAVALQAGAALLVAIVAAAMAGWRGAVSAMLGGIACVVPTLLFAWRLHRVNQRPGSSYPMAFFVGELIKLASAVGLLASIRLVYADALWPAVFAGLVVTLQANLFAFLVKS
jgi:ATP synthase protein I